jgi:hypothetical protein
VPVDQELSGRSENGYVPVLYARVMESPVAASEFGYPVRFGVAWAEAPEYRARIVTSATVLVPKSHVAPPLSAPSRVRGDPRSP